MGDALREAFDEAAKLSKKCVEEHFDNPKVSIIVPVYNVEPYIEECLDSLVGQTLKELEIIFIDDGSADNSLKIIQEYAKYDGRFVILTQKREGQGVGRNKCIEIAKGEYIAFVDPDDKIELNAMEELYNYAKSNNAQVVQFNYTRFGETIKTRLNDYAKKYRKAFGINLSKNNVFSWKDLKNEKLLTDIDFSPCTRFYKTSFVKENQLKFAPTTNGEDHLFVIGMLFKAEKIHFLNKYFYHYRFRKGSTMNHRSDKNFCAFTNLELTQKFLEKENLLPRIDYIFSRYKVQKLFWHYNQIPRENLFDYLERVEDYLTDDEYERFEKLTEYSFLQNIFSVRNEYIEGVKYKYLTILGFKFQLLPHRLNNNILFIQDIGKHKILYFLGIKIKFRSKKISPQPYLNNLDYHLAEHCNLNCKSCDNFSPLAEPCLTKIECFERDIKRFAQISNKKLGTLNLLGGEPLLNPKIIDFMRVARENLPNTNIQIVTNGILLNEQKEDFWHACNKYDIKIVVTKYPIKLNFEKIKNTAKKHNVKFKFYGKTGRVIKTSYHLPLDLEGQQNPTENFAKCFHANNCVMLKNGKIYPCTVAPNIEHFNKFFGYQIPLTDSDGIDIHKATTMAEVLEFIAKPIPFCKYCNVKCRTFGHEWGISKKEIEEWRIKNA